MFKIKISTSWIIQLNESYGFLNTSKSIVDESCILSADPEDEFYKEDEEDIDTGNVHQDDHPELTLDTSGFLDEDLEAYEKFLTTLEGIDYHLMSWDNACKCVNSRYIY